MDTRGGISLISPALAEPLEKLTYMLSWERDLELNWDLDFGMLILPDHLKVS